MLDFNLQDEMAKTAADEMAINTAASEQGVSAAQLEEDRVLNLQVKNDHIRFLAKPKPINRLEVITESLKAIIGIEEESSKVGVCKNCGKSFPAEIVGHGNSKRCYYGTIVRCKSCGCLRSNIYFDSGY